MSEIIFRCDSGNSNEIGTGHIVRCINLAEKLISKKIVSKNQILFLTRGDKHFNLGKKILLNRGFNFIAKSNNVLVDLYAIPLPLISLVPRSFPISGLFEKTFVSEKVPCGLRVFLSIKIKSIRFNAE